MLQTTIHLVVGGAVAAAVLLKQQQPQRTSLVLLMEVIPVSNSASYWLGVIIYALGSDRDIRAGIMAASTYIW